MKNSLIVLLLAGFAFGAQADPINIDMKPGYWQTTVHIPEKSMAQLNQSHEKQMQEAMKGLREQMAAMPAEQREMMKSAMAAQGIEIEGDQINMPSAGMSISKDGIKTKSCVTQEEIQAGSMGKSDDPNCKTQMKQLNKKTLQINQICKGEDPSSMVAEIKLEKPTHYIGSGKMTQMVQGKEMTMEVNLEGTWLAKECTPQAQ